MTQQAADKYIKDLASGGILVVDEDLVPNLPAHAHIVRVPITRMAVEEVGKDLFANIIALGVVTKLSGDVSLDAVREAVANRVPPATLEKNMQALELGFKAV
jgi:2-oxoglutarate ferredoxin oxidoreductase subunit gamma